MSKTTSGFILSSLKDTVKIIQFNRPKRRNALCSEMYNELTNILNEDAHNDEVKVTVLTGVGEYYTSGNDITSASQVNPDEDFEEAMDGKVDMIRRFVAAFIDYPKLLVAVVNGPAIGIGVTTLALCDVVYASDRATFSTPFVNLGLCPEACSSYLFPKIMGRSKASEMLLLNKKLTADEAYRCGLVSAVVPHENLDSVFKDIKKYAELPPNSLKRAKHLIIRNLKQTLHEVNVDELRQLRDCFNSEEMLEALMKFSARKSKL